MRISYPLIILNLCRHKSGFIYRNPPFYATFLRMQLQIAPQICAYNTQRLKVPHGTSSLNCGIIFSEMYKFLPHIHFADNNAAGGWGWC